MRTSRTTDASKYTEISNGPFINWLEVVRIMQSDLYRTTFLAAVTEEARVSYSNT